MRDKLIIYQRHVSSDLAKVLADGEAATVDHLAQTNDLLAKEQIKIDADAAPFWLVLQAADGKVFPLLKDSGSRMFFKDARLLNRPMRLTARRVPNTQFLQVINVHSMVKGKLHEVYYWCDICTIKRFEAGICECCGAPMDFREEPWKGE